MGNSGSKIIRKVIVYAVSLLIVCGVVLSVVFVKQRQEQKEAEAIAAAEEAAKAQAKAAMTEEEIQALYESSIKDGGAAAEGDNSSDGNTGGNANGAEDGSTGETESAETETGEEPYEAPIDFESLWAVNEDVYAWIRVPGTVIDYPVLQHATDNSYYLNYNIDGSHGYPGCIYTENMNSKDFTDNNTVIYGHNMKNGTMFAGLHQYEDMSFLEENDKIYIYMPDKQLEYTIFAAYVYDDRHLLYSFDFTNDDVYANYLEDVFAIRDMSANIRSDISVTKDDNIITLVTCMSQQPNNRLLVQAVLETGEE